MIKENYTPTYQLLTFGLPVGDGGHKKLTKRRKMGDLADLLNLVKINMLLKEMLTDGWDVPKGKML